MRMPTLFLLAVLAILPTTPARALKQPSTPQELAEYAAIQQQMLSHAASIQKWETEVTELKRQRELRETTPTMLRTPAQIANIRTLENSIRRLEIKMSPVAKDIIQRTSALFDLPPAWQTQRIVAGSYAGTDAPWKVGLSWDCSRPLKDAKGDWNWRDGCDSPNDTRGITWPDGRIQVLPLAFKGSPGRLALTIIHETTHVEDLGNPLLAPLPPKARALATERHAREVTRDPLLHDTLILTPAERTDIANDHTQFLRDPERFIPRSLWAFDDGRLGDPPELSIDPEALAALRRDMAGLDSRVEEQRREREVARRSGTGEAEAANVQAFHSEARACYLEPTDAERSLYKVRGWDDYPIRLSGNTEAARVALLFLGACLGGEQPACTNAMPLFQQLRPQYGFPDAIRKSLSTVGVLQSCVDQLVAASRPGDAYERIRKIAVKAMQEPARPDPPQRDPGRTTPRPPREPVDPGPPGPRVPPCLQEEGGRCIRW